MTTLIRMICGLQEPTSGKFALYGIRNDSKDISNSRRRMMGAVVENPSIYLDMTAEENLQQQYRVLGLPSFDDIPELLRLVGLENTGKKNVKNFSLGLKQRLGKSEYTQNRRFLRRFCFFFRQHQFLDTAPEVSNDKKAVFLYDNDYLDVRFLIV